MDDGVTEIEESAETVGDDLEDIDKNGRNGAGLCDGVQFSGTDSSAIRQKHLGGDRGDVEYPGGVSPPGGHTDCGDDGKMCGRWDVEISPGGGGARSSRLIPHTGVHLDTAGNHRGTGVMHTHL